MGLWNTATLDVLVHLDDFHRANDKMVEAGGEHTAVWVSAEVDIDEALEEATIDQLRAALGREEEGWTQGELDAIRDSFAAAATGDIHTAAALLNRIFKHDAQIAAAEDGLATFHAGMAA